MRRFNSLLLTVLFVLGVAGTAFAQGTGRSLDIQPGGRQNGMGAAGVALDEDATGVTWWNPAGLGFVNKSAVEVTYAQLVPGLASDVSYNYATYVHPMSGGGAWGLGLVFLSYGQSDRTNESGTVLGQFGSNEVSPALYYGLKLLPEMSVGASLKFIRIQLAPDDLSGVGSTFGLDVGALYRIPAAKLRLGMNLQNFGPSVTFLNEDQKSPLSRNLKVGAAWQAMTGKDFNLLTVADFNQSLVTNKFRTYNVGLELQYTDQIAGRVGYYSDPLGEIKDLTYGLGLGWKAVSLDYASIPQARDSGLPNVNKITLGYHF
ncbi:MAG: PorV/PorQ family protein [Candidatus Eisenbacteria bacterium]|uniref:PorV/PorQ family protein n=1 Tax=Eiseniibacteriota bacterium TaxID=2212470 RepID=A0A933SBS5_UNCEI|nr:PorV/PorQ family protein [Candidatus Eisenbacteria bacterium]